MKKILSILLVLSMTLSASILLFSCDKDDDKKIKEEEQTALVDDGSIFYERSLVSDDLPDRKSVV